MHQFQVCPPARESADAALSSAVVELAAALPDMSSCKSAGAVLLSANAAIKLVQQKALCRVAGWVFGVNQEAALLQEARETIVAARGLLASRKALESGRCWVLCHAPKGGS